MFLLVNTIKFRTFPHIPNVQIIGRITPYDSFLKFSVRGSSNGGYPQDEKGERKRFIFIATANWLYYIVFCYHTFMRKKYHYTSFISNQRVEQRVSANDRRDRKEFNREGQTCCKVSNFKIAQTAGWVSRDHSFIALSVVTMALEWLQQRSKITWTLKCFTAGTWIQISEKYFCW